MANIFLAEDDKFWLEEVDEMLEKAGHRIVGTAITIEDSLEMIPNFEALDVQVVVHDGNLGLTKHASDLNHDVRQFQRALQKSGYNVGLVVFSNDDEIPQKIDGIDAFVDKSGGSVQNRLRDGVNIANKAREERLRVARGPEFEV